MTQNSPILLTAIDPLMGYMLFAVVMFPIQAILNLIWVSLIHLLKIRTDLKFGRKFVLQFFYTGLFTIIAAVQNAYGPFNIFNFSNLDIRSTLRYTNSSH